MNCKCKKVMVVIPGSVDLYRCDVWQEIFDKMPVIKEISLDTEFRLWFRLVQMMLCVFAVKLEQS